MTSSGSGAGSTSSRSLITIPGLFFILLTPFTDAGLQFTIDYTGGTRWEFRMQDPNVTPDQVEAVFAEHGLESTAITTGSGFIEVKTEALDLAAAPRHRPSPTRLAGRAAARRRLGASERVARRAPRASSGSPAAAFAVERSPSRAQAPSRASREPGPSAVRDASVRLGICVAWVRVRRPGASPSTSPSARRRQHPDPDRGTLGAIAAALQAEHGPIAEQRSLTTIGAVVSSDLIGQAIILILVGSAGIMLWITYRFRDVKFGVTALVALLHDVIVVVGFFAILGTFFRVQIDALFVTAMLTVIGFSVHDTIVVFDRIRENKARHTGEPFADIVNHSILQTFGRSIMTSLTVVLTLLALLLFGGAAISDFILALLIGIVSGTYSSIFVASPAARRLASLGGPPPRPSHRDSEPTSPANGNLRP